MTKLIPFTEAVEQSGLSKYALNQLIENGDVKAKRIGRRWFISEKVWEVFVSEFDNNNVVPTCLPRSRPRISLEEAIRM